MKQLQAEGISTKKKQAQILTIENEILKSKDLLGDHTPQSLFDTIVFCNSLFFALRSRRGHRQWRKAIP